MPLTTKRTNQNELVLFLFCAGFDGLFDRDDAMVDASHTTLFLVG
jgi:hypothetical protein